MDVLHILAKLPPICAALHPTTGQAIILRRGCAGFWPAPETWTRPPELEVCDFNGERRVTAAQREAMLAGSMFGWHVAAADADNYDAVGAPLRLTAAEPYKAADRESVPDRWRP